MLATALALSTACGGTSSENADGSGGPPGDAGSESTLTIADDEPWDAAFGAGLVTVNPVITCGQGAEADESAGQAALSSIDDESCVVGPPAGTGDLFERGSAVAAPDETTGRWVVDVGLRAAGAVVWNAVAQQCVDTDATCPSGRLAVVLDEVVQAAPLVSTPDFGGTVRIAGGFGADEARRLASALNRPADPGSDDGDHDGDDGDEGDDSTEVVADVSPTVSTTEPVDTRAPTTTPDGDTPPGFLLPAMCGLPAAEWTSDEHPASRDQGPWATGSRVEGDLTGDGVEEIVWATVCGAGTIATGRAVHVFGAANEPMATLPVEAVVAEVYPDRTVHPIEPRIEDGEVQLEVWVWQSADASCCPSVAFDMSFAWDGTRFVPTTEIPAAGTARPPSGEAPVVAWDGQYRPKTTPGRIVQLGHVGRQVELLQQALDQRGYDVDVDGYFGNGTEEAVRRFQRDRRLPVTGIASDDVWDEFGE